MMHSLLMIYPKIPVTFWNMKYALQFTKKQSAFIPLGFMTVASLLPEDWDVTLIDLNVSRLDDNIFSVVDMVFISAMIIQKESFEQVIAICRQHRVPIVAGGFIVGFATDTADIFDRQIKFIQDAAIPMAMVGLLSALPATRLYRRLQAEGRLRVQSPFSGNNTHLLELSFDPKLPGGFCWTDTNGF